MPRVSVIVPTFNRPHFLREAVRSTLEQTYDDFELLVVDDGSTDATESVVRCFSDPRLRYLPQAHAGRSSARNRGLKQAAGHYIAFLDDDDFNLPTRLEHQVRVLDAHPDAGLVSAGARCMDDEGRIIGHWIPWMADQEVTPHHALQGSPHVLPSASMFRCSTLDSMDGWFDEGLRVCEDVDFFTRLIMAGCRVSFLKAFVAVYRRHAGSSPGGNRTHGAEYRHLLDKVFKSNTLPACILEDRDRIYALSYLDSACRLYSVEMALEAGSDLLRAAELDEKCLAAAFARKVGRFAGFPWCDPRPYVEFVLAHLPSGLECLRSLRKQIYQEFLDYTMRQVAEAAKADA